MTRNSRIPFIYYAWAAAIAIVSFVIGGYVESEAYKILLHRSHQYHRECVEDAARWAKHLNECRETVIQYEFKTAQETVRKMKTDRKVKNENCDNT